MMMTQAGQSMSGTVIEMVAVCYLRAYGESE